MKTRNNIRAVVYTLRGGAASFLLLRARKGYWQSVNGGRDEGENEIAAVIREVREETGLDALDVVGQTRTTCEYDAVRYGEPIHVLLAAYLVKVASDGEVVIGASEDAHTAYRWVSYDEALEMLDQYPEQRPIFKEVCRKGGIIG